VKLNLTNYNEKVTEFTHSPRKLRRSFLRRGVAREAEPPLKRILLDFGSRLERSGVVKRSITRSLP